MSYLEPAYCHLCANPKAYAHLLNLEADDTLKTRIMEKLTRLGLSVPHLDSDDNLFPKTVCKTCVGKLEKAYQFVLLVESSQEALNVQILIAMTKQDLLDSETIYDKGLSTAEEEIIANSMISIQEGSSSDVSDYSDDDTPIAKLKAAKKDRLIVETIDLSDDENDSVAQNTSINAVQHYTPAESVQNRAASSTIEEFHTKVNQHLNRREGEEEIGSNIFNNDFEVTIVGYRMEIKSKLCSSNIKISNNSGVVNDNTLQYNTQDKGTEYLAIKENEFGKDTEINKAFNTPPIIPSSQSPPSYDETKIIDLGENRINLESIMALEEDESDQSDVEFSDPKLLQDAIVVLNRIDVDVNETVALLAEKTKYDEKMIAEKTKYNEKMLAEKTKYNEKMLAEKTKYNEKMLAEKTKYNEKMLAEKTKDSGYEEMELDVPSSPEAELVPLQSWCEYTWNCALCEKIFPSFDEITEHSKREHNWCNTYQCSYCKFMCCNIISFIKHIEDHDQNLKLSCFKCYTRFKNPNDANGHYKEYIKENTCAGCFKIFKTESELREHIKTYSRGIHLNPISGDICNDFTCKECMTQFQTSPLLHNHIFNFHLESIPDYCGRVWNSSRHISDHYDKPAVPCKICCGQFKSAEELMLHTRVHDCQNVHRCPHCPLRSFKYHSSYRHHLWKYHQNLSNGNKQRLLPKS